MSLFGHSDTGATRRAQYWPWLSQYDAAFNDAFSPEAYQNQLSSLTADTNRNFEGLRAAGAQAYGGAGFHESPTYDLAQSQFTATQAAGLREKIRQAKMAAIAERLRLTSGGPDDKTDTGLIPTLANYAGQAAAAGAFGHQPGAQTAPTGMLPAHAAMPAPAQTPHFLNVHPGAAGPVSLGGPSGLPYQQHMQQSGSMLPYQNHKSLYGY